MTSVERQQFNEWKIRNNKVYRTTEDEENAAQNFLKVKKMTENFNNQVNKTYSQSYHQPYADVDPKKLMQKRIGFKIPDNIVFNSFDSNTENYESDVKINHNEKISEKTSSKVIKKNLPAASLKKGPNSAFKKPADLKTTIKTLKNKLTTTYFIKSTTAKLFKIPNSINHTNHMQEVKNQMDCGACYIIAPIALIEYDSKVNLRINHTLSVQNVLDCIDHEDPCSGGWPGIAFDFIKNKGVADGKYVYTGEPEKCNKTFPPARKISNWCVFYLSGNEIELQKLVAKQPVVVGVSLTINMMYYKRGVFQDEECSNQVDHALVIVGYGTDEFNGDYWIVMNSWGKNWGMNGYGWFARNKNNSCGIANVAFNLC